MAITSFTFGKVGYVGGGGVIPALVVDGTLTTESKTPSGSNQTTTAVATSAGGASGVRVVTDTSVYVSFGAAPNATSDGGRILILANQSEYFMLPAGYKAAVATP